MKYATRVWPLVGVVAVIVLAAMGYVQKHKVPDSVPLAAPAPVHVKGGDLSALADASTHAGTPNAIHGSSFNSGQDWADEYEKSRNYFSFISAAALKAINGDSRAAYYISRALFTCQPLVSQYQKSADPEAKFNSYWAQKTKTPQWVIDGARRDFQACAGLIRGDAFASLPSRPEGYNSIRYWRDLAAKDPLAQIQQADLELSRLKSDGNPETNSKIVQAAQDAVNKAVSSGDVRSLFKVGQLFLAGSASSDPIQGYAVSLAACDLGYDCTTNNTDLFRNCVAVNQCSAGTQYTDIVKKALGESGYTAAYVRALEIEDAFRRNDTEALREAVILKPPTR